MRKGAFDYVMKDEIAQESIVYRLKRLLHIFKLEQDKKNLRKGQILVFSVMTLFFGTLFLLVKLGVF
ncbi:MAG: hypothetical protein HC896_18675 [Bacteroidales bacterium]|nr:hypothetical protein [Bacteroidales bacterium]